MIQIPDVRRKKVDEAQAILMGLGFTVVIDRGFQYIGLNRVTGSDPDAGTLAPRGSTVTLEIV